MALLELVRENQTPAQKLEQAVRHNDVTSLEELISSGIDVNIRLQRHGGNTAMHLAAQLGRDACIQKLLSAGAKADIQNDFGLSPLYKAMRFGNFKTVFFLLCESGGSDLHAIFSEERFWKRLLPTYSEQGDLETDERTGQQLCNDKVWSRLLCGIPTLAPFADNLRTSLFHHCLMNQFWEALRVWLATGNKLTESQLDRILGDERITGIGPEDRRSAISSWFRDYQKMCKSPFRLQFYCKLAVRRCFHGKCNVYYGVRHLEVALPVTLRLYLTDNTYL